MSTPRILRILPAIAFALTAPLAAQAGPWTAIGATGVMDESEYSPVVTFTMATSSLSRAPGVTATVEARWDVQNVNAPYTTSWDTLEVVNYDNSSVNAIRAYLYRVHRCTGALTTICSLTSTNSTSTKCDYCRFVHAFDFAHYSYFIYAYFTGADAASQPAIRALSVH